MNGVGRGFAVLRVTASHDSGIGPTSQNLREELAIRRILFWLQIDQVVDWKTQDSVGCTQR